MMNIMKSLLWLKLIQTESSIDYIILRQTTMADQYLQSDMYTQYREFSGQKIFNLGSQKRFPQASQNKKLQSEPFYMMDGQRQQTLFKRGLKDCLPLTFQDQNSYSESCMMESQSQQKAFNLWLSDCFPLSFRNQNCFQERLYMPFPLPSNQDSEESFLLAFKKQNLSSEPSQNLMECFKIANDQNIDHKIMIEQKMLENKHQNNENVAIRNVMNQNYERLQARINQSIEDLKWKEKVIFSLSKQPIYSLNCQFESQTEEDSSLHQKSKGGKKISAQSVVQKKKTKPISEAQRQKLRRTKARRRAYYQQIRVNKGIQDITKRNFLFYKQQAKSTQKWILEKLNNQKKNKGDDHTCKICQQKFETGRQLGGHVSRSHPSHRAEYETKKNYQKVKMCQKDRRNFFKQRKIQIQHQGTYHELESENQIPE